MKFKKIIFFCLQFVVIFINAQIKTGDSIEFAHFNCGIIQTKQKLDKHFFASTPPIEFRVNNEGLTYSTFQLGKRKKKMYLYLKILEDNVCLKKDRNVDVYFKSGEIITLKNEYPLNCDSFFARQLKKKELKKLSENEITLIKIYTYKKNYEMYVSEVKNEDIHHYIDCLSEYKIRNSDEVKVKKLKDSKLNNKKSN